MLGSIRLEHPGAFYHVMVRGNRRERIFAAAVDPRSFLHTLGEACGAFVEPRPSPKAVAKPDELDPLSRFVD